MNQEKAYRWLNIASVAVIVLVAFIVSMFLYIRFGPVDVINNKTWVLCTAPLQDHKCKTGVPTYKVGDTVSVYINSDKVRNVGGFFTVTAECKNQAGVFVSYPISESHVNRAKGHVETEIDTKAPGRVSPIPTTCRIAYVLEYSVYSFRSFSEYNFSNEFRLVANDTTINTPTNPSISYVSPPPPAKSPAPSTPSGGVTSLGQGSANPTPVSPQLTPEQPTNTVTEPISEPTESCKVSLLFVHLICSEE